MKHQAVSRFSILFFVLFGTLLGGCASQPNRVPMERVSVDGLPQTLLSGASLDNARSVAMGAARTKGWQIGDAAANRLLLQRPLPPQSPQAAALGLSPDAAPPRMEVETNLVERDDGTIVALRALIVTDPGSEAQKRIDYTKDYENELLISLSALQNAWLTSRGRVVSDIPVPGAEQVAGADAGADQDIAPSPQADAAPVPEPAATAQAESGSPAAASAAETAAAQTERSAGVAPAVAPTGAAATSSRALAPVSSLDTGTTSAAPVGTVQIDRQAAEAERNDMLVLSQSTRKGLWAYYAEDYAREQGCRVGDRGAVLLQETVEYELHEVECIDAPNRLLRCQGGVCRAMR